MIGPRLPATTQPLIINGYSQPLASANTQAAGENAVFKIVLDYSNVGAANTFGLDIQGGNSTVRGMVNRGRFESRCPQIV